MLVVSLMKVELNCITETMTDWQPVLFELQSGISNLELLQIIVVPKSQHYLLAIFSAGYRDYVHLLLQRYK